MRNWSTLVHKQTTGKHELTRLTTAQTWGKPPPFPLKYILCMAMGLAPKCHFVPGLSFGGPKNHTVGTLTTLGAHNFAHRPPIEMRSKAKLYPLSRSFNGMLHTTFTQGNQGDF